MQGIDGDRSKIKLRVSAASKKGGMEVRRNGMFDLLNSQKVQGMDTKRAMASIYTCLEDRGGEREGWKRGRNEKKAPGRVYFPS